MHQRRSLSAPALWALVAGCTDIGDGDAGGDFEEGDDEQGDDTGYR